MYYNDLINDNAVSLNKQNPKKLNLFTLQGRGIDLTQGGNKQSQSEKINNFNDRKLMMMVLNKAPSPTQQLEYELENS